MSEAFSNKEKKMRKSHKIIILTLTACAFVLAAIAPKVLSHCEIPCGIYDDQMRIDIMAEHVKTIEKSIREIKTLRAEKNKNYNQLVRWIMNKENHADKLSEIVTQYFMKQRIKPAPENDKKTYQSYVKKLTLLHRIMVYSMKCKQTTDLQNVDNLRKCLDKFENAYFEKKTNEHGEHHMTEEHGEHHQHHH